MAQSYKICPICGAQAHHNAILCATCGTTLTDVPVTSRNQQQQVAPAKTNYEFHYGENDLYEGQINNRSNILFVGAMLGFLALFCGGFSLFLGQRFLSAVQLESGVETATPVPTQEQNAIPLNLATNTPRPSLEFVTVTQPPPTPEPTATQGPCIVTVQSGDDLITLAWACGHRSLNVIPLILDINDLDSPEQMKVGQVLEIPNPTPTIDPNAAPTAASNESNSGGGIPDAERTGTISPAEIALRNSSSIATETLAPGIAWHEVQPNENMVSIAFTYGANIEIMSQLNPEVQFARCDFGSPAGGPDCIVSVFTGQLLRVPAPTPTMTLSPTISGSETATPTPTATFNAPNLTHPGNRNLFEHDELITLRWVTTGSLGVNDAYRLHIEDITAGVLYTADTQDLYFIVPEDWQPQDGKRHDYSWSVSVITADAPNEPRYTTESRIFTWQGRRANP